MIPSVVVVVKVSSCDMGSSNVCSPCQFVGKPVMYTHKGVRMSALPMILDRKCDNTVSALLVQLRAAVTGPVNIAYEANVISGSM